MRRSDSIYVTQSNNIGYGEETKFGLTVDRKDQLLRKALLVYLGAASDFAGKCSSTLTLHCHSFMHRA